MAKRSGIAFGLAVVLCGIALIAGCGSRSTVAPSTGASETTTATASQNLGSISLDKNGYTVLDAQGQPKKVLGVADARIDTATGKLICSTVDTATLDPGNRVTAAGIFHNYGYPFYYFNLRANAANRIARYLAKR